MIGVWLHNVFSIVCQSFIFVNSSLPWMLANGHLPAALRAVCRELFFFCSDVSKRHGTSSPLHALQGLQSLLKLAYFYHIIAFNI